LLNQVDCFYNSTNLKTSKMIAEQKVFDKLRLQESLIKNFQEVIHHIQDELVEKNQWLI
jgi:hypothetical protein